MRKNKPKKEGIYKLTAVVLAALLSITSTGTVAKAEGETKDYGLRSPRVAIQTRETVYFGNYWQEDTNGDGVADKNDEKMPIQWQILKKYDDGTALLISDKILDSKSYFEGVEKTRINEETGQEEKYTDYSCTWETSDIRKWLNGESEGDFYYEAFNLNEQNEIISERIINSGINVYGIDGGNDTDDKVFLLSVDDSINVTYGFNNDRSYSDQSRASLVTQYASWYATGEGLIYETGDWWLRSTGINNRSAYFASSFGSVSDWRVSHWGGIRPVIHIKLSNSFVQNGADNIVAVNGSEWDTISFGNYGDEKITWRVLNVNDDDAFIISEKVLDYKIYNDHKDAHSVWKESAVRKWLNDEFYNNSFSDVEKNAIKNTNVIISDNPYFVNEKGENTIDKIFLLSLNDTINLSYGFPNLYAFTTDLRKSFGKNGVGENWWLRTDGFDVSHTAFVDYMGNVSAYGKDGFYSYDVGIRPCLHIDLSSSAWKKGEPVKVGDPTGGTEIPLDSNSRTDFPIDNTKKDTTESNQTTETKNPQQPVDSKPTPQETFKNAGAGVGKISSDGKKLVDTDNKTWQMSNKLENKDLKKNLNVAVKNGGKYKITKVTKKGGKVTGGTITYMAPYDKNCKLISATGIVKLAGVNFKVTQIAPKCAKGCKKLKKVVIGSYVTTIGANAFSGCCSLTTVTIKKGSLTSIGTKAFYDCKKLNSFSVTGLKLKKVGSNAFKNTNSKITFKCPKSKLKNYEKLFKKSGASKKAKYTK